MLDPYQVYKGPSCPEIPEILSYILNLSWNIIFSWNVDYVLNFGCSELLLSFNHNQIMSPKTYEEVTKTDNVCDEVNAECMVYMSDSSSLNFDTPGDICACW